MKNGIQIFTKRKFFENEIINVQNLIETSINHNRMYYKINISFMGIYLLIESGH